MLYKNVSKKLVEKIYDLYEDDFKLFGYRPDDALRIAKEKDVAALDHQKKNFQIWMVKILKSFIQIL